MTAIVSDLDAPRAAMTLLAAGHVDAAADVLVSASRMTRPVVDLLRDGRDLRVRIREA